MRILAMTSYVNYVINATGDLESPPIEDLIFRQPNLNPKNFIGIWIE